MFRVDLMETLQLISVCLRLSLNCTQRLIENKQGKYHNLSRVFKALELGDCHLGAVHKAPVRGHKGVISFIMGVKLICCYVFLTNVGINLNCDSVCWSFVYLQRSSSVLLKKDLFYVPLQQLFSQKHYKKTDYVLWTLPLVWTCFVLLWLIQ